MARIVSAFRKYHRQLSVILFLPLFLITLTGIALPLSEKLHNEAVSELIRKLHSGEFFGSDLVYSVLVGLGLLGLLITGLSLTGLFGRRRPS